MARPVRFRVRFRKMLKKGAAKQLAFQAPTLSESFGIQALESGRISEKVLGQISLLLSRSVKKGSKIVLCVHPNHPVTAKPSEVRMGKGKGVIKDWVAKVRKGTIIFEILGNKVSANKRFLKNLCLRFPVKVVPTDCKRF